MSRASFVSKKMCFERRNGRDGICNQEYVSHMLLEAERCVEILDVMLFSLKSQAR